MFGSILLDVVIGLVFIFLLYSLLATILQEIIGGWLKLRSRVLRKAIERMLNDGYVRERGKNASWKWTDLTIGKAKEFEHSMAHRFYEHPSIKYLSKKSRKPSYISAVNFAETLFNLIREKGVGETEIEKAGFALRFNTLRFEKQTLRHIRDIYLASANDVNVFRQNLEKWFDETMDRTTGWYKRKVKLILFIIGFVLAVTFNVDIIRIAQTLAKDKDARAQMVQMGIAATDSTSGFGKHVKYSKDTAMKSLADTAYKEVRAAIDSSQHILGGGWKGTPPEQVKSALKAAVRFWEQPFWGFLITALGISLGANFWFGLLNKLVALRNAGVKPEEKKKDGENPPPAKPVVPSTVAVSLVPESVAPALNQVEEAIRQHAPALRQIAGVMSVFAARKKNAATQSVQVNVADADTATLVENACKALKEANKLAVNFDVVVSGVPVHHMADDTTEVFNHQVANKERKSFGSLGCVLKNTQSGEKHLLSCWHVLKGNSDFSHDDAFPAIIDHKSTEIAERWGGGIAGAFDYGIAQYHNDIPSPSNAFLKQALGMKPADMLNYRSVVKSDLDAQINVTYFDCFTQQLKQGIIYAGTDSLAINYPDKTRVLQDVLLLTAADDEVSISQPGNSGALLFDSSNKAIAMIIGGDKKYTYAIKLSNIFRIHPDMSIANA